MTWRERIAAARTAGRFSMEETRLAGCWETCAVGEQYATHDFLGWGSMDPILAELGDGNIGPEHMGFGYAVSANNFDAAENALDAIEDRVLQLKREAQP